MDRFDRNAMTGDRLTLPASVEDGRIPGFAQSLLYSLSGFVLLAAIWLSVAEVRERVVAAGSLVPAASVQSIEHLEGGIVETVLVEEGQIVDAGTVLVRLRPTASASDLEQLRVRAAGLELEQIRMDATLAGQVPDFGEIGARFPELAADQMRLYRSDRAHIDKTRETMVSRAARSAAEVRSLEAQHEALASRLEIQNEQLAMREALLKDGFSSKRDYLDTKLQMEQVRADLIANDGRLEAMRDELAEAGSALEQSDAEAARRLAEERSRSARELAEIRQQLAKQSDRVERLEVRAPVDSVVQTLAVRSAGEVVNAGDPIARIVPIGAKIVAEVRIAPKDVAQVDVGQPAEITVTAFDPNIYGKVTGKVRVISPSTFQDDDGNTYYKATIDLDSEVSAGGAHAMRLLPGMIIEANITTNAKSIMRYLLKPVYRSLDRAFTER